MFTCLDQFLCMRLFKSQTGRAPEPQRFIHWIHQPLICVSLRLLGQLSADKKGGPACIRRQLFAENPSTGALLLENDLQFRRCGLSGKNLRNKHRLEWRLGIFPQAEQDLFN